MLSLINAVLSCTQRSEELKEAAKELEEKVELFRRLQEMEGKVKG